MSYSQLVWSEDLPIQLVGNQTQKETVWPGVMGYAAELPYKKAFHEGLIAMVAVWKEDLSEMPTGQLVREAVAQRYGEDVPILSDKAIKALDAPIANGATWGTYVWAHMWIVGGYRWTPKVIGKLTGGTALSTILIQFLYFCARGFLGGRYIETLKSLGIPISPKGWAFFGEGAQGIELTFLMQTPENVYSFQGKKVKRSKYTMQGEPELMTNLMGEIEQAPEEEEEEAQQAAAEVEGPTVMKATKKTALDNFNRAIAAVKLKASEADNTNKATPIWKMLQLQYYGLKDSKAASYMQKVKDLTAIQQKRIFPNYSDDVGGLAGKSGKLLKKKGRTAAEKQAFTEATVDKGLEIEEIRKAPIDLLHLASASLVEGGFKGFGPISPGGVPFYVGRRQIKNGKIMTIKRPKGYYNPYNYNSRLSYNFAMMAYRWNQFVREQQATINTLNMKDRWEYYAERRKNAKMSPEAVKRRIMLSAIRGIVKGTFLPLKGVGREDQTYFDIVDPLKAWDWNTFKDAVSTRVTAIKGTQQYQNASKLYKAQLDMFADLNYAVAKRIQREEALQSTKTLISYDEFKTKTAGDVPEEAAKFVVAAMPANFFTTRAGGKRGPRRILMDKEQIARAAEQIKNGNKVAVVTAKRGLVARRPQDNIIKSTAFDDEETMQAENAMDEES